MGFRFTSCIAGVDTKNEKFWGKNGHFVEKSACTYFGMCLTWNVVFQVSGTLE